MKIIRVSIFNYRNIGGISVDLDKESNYIIGENNIGKSNFLALLENVCNGWGFQEEDFADSEKLIEIQLKVQLLPYEQGFFGDNFSSEDSSIINIKYAQGISDSHPEIICTDTNESIQVKQLKKLHFLKYDTNSVPSKELKLDTQKGAGALVGNIIDRFIENNADKSEFLDKSNVDNLITYINSHLSKIKAFCDYDIKAVISPKPTEMLSRLFYLSDDKRKIDSTGSGVQFMAMASINILCQIMDVYKSKVTPFNEQLYVTEDGKKFLPLILSIDEPEVHLHPFLQRSLIEYYKKILSNRDNDFVDLLKMCFGIDGINGQLIIVTHSTDALMDSYKNIIRFYKSEGVVKTISGSSLQLTDTNEKHLLMRFPEIKEAFYSHCAILIEGETEFGCMYSFAETLGISLNEYGISIINAGGENSIKPLKRLLAAFGIPSVSIYDKDVKQGVTPDNDEFFTTEMCFEIEIVKNLYSNQRANLVKQIALDLDSNAEQVELDANFVRKGFEKCKVDISTYVPKKLSDVLDTNESEFCAMYSSWFIVKKSVLLGRIVGTSLSADLIPSCYKDAIIRAKEVASNA